MFIQSNDKTQFLSLLHFCTNCINFGSSEGSLKLGRMCPGGRGLDNPGIEVGIITIMFTIKRASCRRASFCSTKLIAIDFYFYY